MSYRILTDILKIISPVPSLYPSITCLLHNVDKSGRVLSRRSKAVIVTVRESLS